MLSRPEINTREHILLWLASKPADEKYDWGNPFTCACGQYCNEFLGGNAKWVYFASRGLPLGDINYFAACCRSRTFGQLYLLMREVWQEK